VRKANLIQTAIWDDDQFAVLGADAKLAYVMLLTQAKVTAVGALDLAPKRWADSTSLTPARLTKALAELERDGFIWTDPAKEELVIRSWVKHNVVGSPKMVTAAADQFSAVSSRKLQNRLQMAYPSLFGEPDLGYLESTDTLYRNSDEVAGAEVQGAEVHSLENDARARVWSAYQAHHPRASFSVERKRLIDSRLREGFSVDQLIAAIEGNHRDAYCNGANRDGRQYHAFNLILRDADKIEQYGDVPASGSRRLSESDQIMESSRQLAEQEAGQR
jgi:hypothetical protein